MKLPFLEVYEY